MDTKRDITIDDLFRIKLLNSPEISPSGDRIIFSYKWTDLKAAKYFSNLYVAHLKDGKIQQFTHGECHDLYPLWSPDGTSIVFRSDRNDKKGLWLIPVDGGEAIPFMTEKGTLGEYIWSPDSTKIAYTFRKPDEPIRPEHISYDPEYKPKDDERPYDIIEEIPYKTKSGEIKPRGKFHIYMIDLATKEITQLTDGIHDEGSLSFSPDGKKIAFTSNRNEDPIHDFEHVDIFILTLEGRETRKVTRQWGPKSGLAWSSDMSCIFFTGHHAPKGMGGPENYKLYKVPVAGGDTIVLTKDFDGHLSNMLIGDTREFDDCVQPPLFIDNEKNLLFCASYHGGCYIYEIPVDGGVPKKIEDGPIDISYCSIDRSRKNLAVLKGDMLSPSEVYHYRKGDKGWEIKQLTSYNEFLREELTISEPEELWFTNSEGIRLQGWLQKPPGFDPSKKYPLVHEIHGGPHILYGYTFFHEIQLFAARGYCVLYINPRGSRGYGTAFTAAVHRNWGGPDKVDQMEFLDHVISKGFIDEHKLFLTGGSYGGFMTNWLVTQTDRYCAAASHRSVSHMASHFGVSCGNLHFEFTFGGVPWRDFEHYRQHSPYYLVENVHTPFLIMHSENDNLCPLGEAEQMFVALRYLNKKARFVRFKNETHELSRGGKPSNRRARLELVLEWFETYRNNAASESLERSAVKA
jgi:dipeptidyl aminopeptidase/acylaminoacyl peptidase